MGEHFLIAYASRFGSTADVAQAIAETLGQTGATADVRPVAEVTRLERYDGIVLGSAIRGGKWLPEAIQFLEAHRSVLATMPVAYFTLCLTLRNDTPDNRRTVFSYHAPLVRDFPEVRPISIGMFAGMIDFEDLPSATRRMARNSSIPEGDFRDWSLIREWTLSLKPLFADALNAHSPTIS